MLRRQEKIQTEFLIEMEECTELPSLRHTAPNSQARFYMVGSIREDVSLLINDVLDGKSYGVGERSWEEMPPDLYPGSSWNLLWAWSQPKVDLNTLLTCQKVNRFRSTRCLTRKDLLKKNIDRFCESRVGRKSPSKSALHPERYSDNYDGIMPLTFVLPQEYSQFVTAFSALQRSAGGNDSNFWILKPIGLSRGRGISVVNDIGEVAYSQPIVVQRYLMDPFLFHNYKFDLRLYILVTQFQPLEAFVYVEGLARFASKPFSADPECVGDERIHLTNSSIQKEYLPFDGCHPVCIAGSDGGDNKIKLTWLWKRLEAQGIDTKVVWARIKELCLRTLLSVAESIPPQPNSFEVYGVDIILDECAKPWLVEVNACPALARDSDLDSDVKEALLRDTVALINPSPFDREALRRICKRRGFTKSNPRSHVCPTASDKDLLENDLRDIFMGQPPRQYGELPDTMGGYERIAPGTSLYEKLRSRQKKKGLRFEAQTLP